MKPDIESVRTDQEAASASKEEEEKHDTEVPATE